MCCAIKKQSVFDPGKAGAANKQRKTEATSRILEGMVVGHMFSLLVIILILILLTVWKINNAK